MKRYPVYKALYKPVLTFGVPMMALILEIVFALLFCAVRLFVLVIPLVIVHIIIMTMHKQDPHILTILMDVSSLKN